MADLKPSILVVDDEMSIRESFSLILGKEFSVITAASGEASLKKIIDEKIDLVYLDMKMPGMNGIETLKRIKEIDPTIDVIMVTAVNDISSAGTAIKLGAKDYVVKPFDIDDILNRTRSIIIKSQTKGINMLDKEELIGTSRHMTEIEAIIEREAKKDSFILVVGEKGVETEQIARLISVESEKLLKIFNVTSAFRDQILFGIEKGQFTEAFKKESGCLEDGNGGILLIRNIELLPLNSQEKLKTALLNKKYFREGSQIPVTLNIRIIAETSEDLKDLADSGMFNKELYKILSKVTISLPPLREREGDLPVLINHFIDMFNKKHFKNIKGPSKEVLDILTSYSWPGNTVELANVIETLALTADKEEILPDDLPLDILINSASSAKKFITLEYFENRFEKGFIEDVYIRNDKNKQKTAEALGIQVKSLEEKLGSM